MSKMIKLSDEVGALLEERAKADGQTLAGEVNLLLRGNNLDKEYFDNKFREQQEAIREMRSLIEDTTIDRVENKVGRVSGKIHLDWETSKEIFYEVMRDGGPEWFSEQTKFAIENLDTSLDCYIENDTLCSDDAYGTKRVILSISPRIKEFLKSKGIDI